MRFIPILMLLQSLHIYSAQSELEGLSFLNKSFAPNVDGQNAYSLKLTFTDQEFSLLSNEDLQAGSSSLIGVTWDYRIPSCAIYCSFSHALLLGGGLTTAGPLLELTWSFNLFWLARLDFTSHYFVSTTRLINWSYPLWLGFTLPL